MGGFHLAQASESRLKSSVDALRELNLGLIVPCHCTGDAAVERLRRAFGDRVIPGMAGVTHTFGE
jgi:7,8-dihydropterin-6-yl-methyl-4-(beta-D-ribofuranosyl)aminobenzene 5'-phosphate synthase